MYTDGYTIV